MATYLKRSVAVSVTLIHCWYSPSLLAAEPFIIDDENLSFDTLYSTTVYGFRAFPISNIVARDFQSGFTIKADVLNASLQQIMPGQSVTLHDLDRNPSLVSTIAQGYTPVFISAEYDEQTNLAWQKWSAPSSGEYDASFIASAFGTELVDQEFIRRHEVTVDQIGAIDLDPNVAKDLLTVYAGLNSLRDYEATRIPATFDQFNNALAQHEQLYAVAKLPLGDVDMGQPLILEPSVLRVEVPEEWAAEYTVKLILFAITVRDYLAGVEKIDISIKLPPESIAIDLVPLSYVGEPLNVDQKAETQDLLTKRSSEAKSNINDVSNR